MCRPVHGSLQRLYAGYMCLSWDLSISCFTCPNVHFPIWSWMQRLCELMQMSWCHGLWYIRGCPPVSLHYCSIDASACARVLLCFHDPGYVIYFLGMNVCHSLIWSWKMLRWSWKCVCVLVLYWEIDSLSGPYTHSLLIHVSMCEFRIYTFVPLSEDLIDMAGSTILCFTSTLYWKTCFHIGLVM